jgi:hypothetical protein
MYGMAGAAEFTNWPRLVIGIEPTEDPTVFKMIAAKRWKRSGWEDAIQHISYSKDPQVMMWIPATDEQVSDASKKGIDPQDILQFVTGIDPVPFRNIECQAKLKGFNHTQVKEAVIEALKRGLLFKDVIRACKDGKLLHPKPTYGYVTSEPVYDFEADLLALVPGDGIKTSDLIEKAKEVHGYYVSEIEEPGRNLVRDGRLIRFSGEGREKAAQYLVRAECKDAYQAAHPNAEAK